MENSPVLLIINPAAGSQDPVKELVALLFKKSRLILDFYTLKEGENAGKIAREHASRYKMIAIYGGDGSVTEAAAGLIGTKVPLAIVPGGTANVLAKELGIPQDTEEALLMIRDGHFKLKRIDTGTVNEQPFLLRVNLGLMADMITGADPALKNKIGQLAYGISAVKSWQEIKVANYRLVLDGEPMEISGATLTVTNVGGVGIAGLQLAQNISLSDGLLDLILLKEAGIFDLAEAAGSSLLGKESDAIGHWTCREVKIDLEAEQSYLRDDSEARADKLIIRVVPRSLTVVVPKTAN